MQKCKVITFTRTSNKVQTIYKIEDTPLERVDQIVDLRVIFSADLSFEQHVQKMLNSTKRNLGVLMRNSKLFKNILTLTVLYFALVKSHLDFGSSVWGSIGAEKTKRIERVQKLFLKYLYYKNFSCPTESLS